MGRKILKFLPLCILALMLGLFFFSSQESGETNSVSWRVCSAAARVFYFNFEYYEPETQETLILGLNPFIRKAAHFALYALLGALCYLWLRKLRHNLATAMSLCALFAALDEFHQLFVAGRTGKLSDVLLDCAGSACGIGAAFLLLCLVHCLHDRRIVEKGVWKQ